jgi:hypothetical protein
MFAGEEGTAMSRVNGTVCVAAILLLAAAGCESLRNFQLTGSAFLTGGGNDRVVAGSIDSVSASTQDTLRGLGLMVTASREGEAIRLRTTTLSGQHVDLVLTREKTQHGELTHVRFEWERDRDENMELQILSQVEVQGRN